MIVNRPSALVLIASGILCSVAVAVDNRQTIDGVEFRLAPGLELRRVAGPDLIRWPVVMDWDREGRLVVVESGGVGWPIQEHNEKKLHRIVRLSDEDGDGTFDKRIVAAKDLAFTEGVLCLGDDILAAAPPYIWKLTDADGDGVCEHREIWFDGQTVTGCANDLHGPYLGFDGWIYWCKGAFGEQRHTQIDGSTIHDKAAHIYRRRIEGGPIESVVSGGMDNPVEVAFTPSGDMFFTSTFLQHPKNGKRDGIAHAVYGSVFGKDHHVVDGQIRTGPLAPIMTHLGPAAPSGMLRLSSNAFNPILGRQTNDANLIVAQFNLHKVTSHQLLESRSTFTTRDLVLVETDRVDFHPTDVLEGSWGEIFVADTGGWYDLCCPTSRVNQKVASGAIYRLAPKQENVRRQNRDDTLRSSIRSATDWDRIGVDDCIRLLSDPRPWIQREAVLQLAKAENRACLPLARLLEPNFERGIEIHEQLRRSELALMALSMIGTPEALSLISRGLEVRHLTPQLESDSTIAIASCRILGTHRHRAAKDRIEKLLSSRSLYIARAAVEALGRIGESGSTKLIVEQCSQAVAWNPVFKHSVLFALLELREVDVLRETLEQGTSIEKLVAMEALHRLGASGIRDFVLKAAFAKETGLRVAARNVLFAHPEWAKGSKEFMGAFQSSELTEARFPELLRAWKGSNDVQEFVLEHVGDEIAQTGSLDAKGIEWLELWLDKLPTAFVPQLTTWTRNAPEKAATALCRFQLNSEDHAALIHEIELQLKSTLDPEVARSLLMALPAHSTIELAELTDLLIERRDYASLEKMALDQEDLRRLLDVLDEASLQQLEQLVHIFAKSDEESALAMLGRLRSLGRARMLDENLLPNAFKQSSEQIRALVAEVNEVLHRPPVKVAQTLERVLESLPIGDPVNGLQVFRSQKAGCSACHRVGYIGGQIGPELTRIGKTRTRESLLEAVLFPSQRIEQGYRPIKVLTVDGLIHSGIELRGSPGTTKLQANAEKTVVVDDEEIAQKLPSETSIMPAGIREQLSEQELADLLALLEAAK